MLEKWDKQFLWHPFTQQSEWDARTPLIIQSAKGIWLKDQHGRKLLDGVSSLWVNVFGHQVPEIDRAIQKQLKQMAHTTFLGLSHEPAIRLAKELIRIAPQGLSRVFYSDNGSTSVEVALKMSYQYWQLTGHTEKKLFLSMQHGYHGDTLGSVSVGGVSLFHERFSGLLFRGVHLPPGDFKTLRAAFQKHHSKLAAVVMEPLIQGASGMLLMPKGYLKEVERLCRKWNVHLIVDEVATGFGRTGKMFAVEHENVRPDFLCVAKSITGGYLPLAATLATEKIFKAYRGRYDEFKTFFHGHTYTANPLACAAALATLRLYQKKKLIAHVQKMSKLLSVLLHPLKAHPHVKEIRQLGLMVGIELVQNKKTAQPFAPGLRMGLQVCDAAIERGVWLRPLGDVVVLMPPLAISESNLRFLVGVVSTAIQTATNAKNPL